MALSQSCLKLFANEVASIESFPKDFSALILGFPELGTSTSSQLSDILGVDLKENCFRAYLSKIGAKEVHIGDVSAYEGCDVLIDLNMPNPTCNKYDLIIDNGTLEHCFNVAQGFANIARMLKPGGICFHMNPANLVGHGFWNFSPCTYFDFYQLNGFKVKVYIRSVESGAYEEVVYKPKITKILPSKRYIYHAIATKLAEVPLAFPLQQHFLDLYTSSTQERSV